MQRDEGMASLRVRAISSAIRRHLALSMLLPCKAAAAAGGRGCQRQATVACLPFLYNAKLLLANPYGAGAAAMGGA